MTRRPLSRPASGFGSSPVVQTRWAATIVALRCSGCTTGVEAGERFLETRTWRPGGLRPTVSAECSGCVEARRVETNGLSDAG